MAPWPGRRNRCVGVGLWVSVIGALLSLEGAKASGMGCAGFWLYPPSRTKGPIMTKPRAIPRVRSPELDLDASIPRHWWDDNVFVTHVANGVAMLFPAGERFFVRSVHHYAKSIDDDVLRKQVDRFFKQEGRHAKEHDRMTRVLAEQGFDVDRFLELYERLGYGIIERISPPQLRLATTAACEHFTALLAEEALTTRFLDSAHPAVRALLLWHSAEEIEHRAVAFDVLAKVAPSYALRMAGLGVASACLAGFWCLATASLLLQERNLGVKRLWRDLVAFRAQPGRSVFVDGIRAYVRRDFHPSNLELDALAAEYFAAAGLEPTDVAA